MSFVHSLDSTQGGGFNRGIRTRAVIYDAQRRFICLQVYAPGQMYVGGERGAFETVSTSLKAAAAATATEAVNVCLCGRGGVKWAILCCVYRVHCDQTV